MSQKKSEFLSAGCKMIEVWKALINAVLDKGGTDDDVRRIFTDKELANDLADRIVVKSKFPSLTLAADLIPEYRDESGRKRKWEVVEDVAPTLNSASGLEFISFMEPGEPVISSEKMRWRAKKLHANLGLADAKFLLEHQDRIPVEFRGSKYIVFPGTVLHDSDGIPHVACLRWRDVRWRLYFHWLGIGWDDDCLARCK